MSVRYCGQVSAKTRAPRRRARRISSSASPLETCTIVSGTPAISASVIARCTASRSTGTGRVVAWWNGPVRPVALGLVAQERDRVLVFGMDHDHCAVRFGHRHHIEDLAVRQRRPS